jgi:hypothetical protein
VEREVYKCFGFVLFLFYNCCYFKKVTQIYKTLEIKYSMEIEMKIEHWRKKAELFLEKNIQCFIKTLDGTYHSADILLVGQDAIYIYDFIKKKKFRIYWLDIFLFEEYQEGK